MPDYGNGGMLVNASTQFTNAYTGQAVPFDAQHTLTPVMNKTYYDTQAIENVKANEIFAQFGRKQSLPLHHGTTIERRKPNTFGDVQRLEEGVIPVGKKFGYSFVTMEIFEYGDYAALTTWVDQHAIDPVMLDMTEELTNAGVATRDKLVRDELLTGTVVYFAPKIAADGTETEVLARAEIDKTCILTPDLVARVATELATMRAPRMEDGSVAVGIVHPQVAYDLRRSEGWMEAHKYAAPEQIFNGEIGKLHGIRFIESPDAKIFKAKNLAGDTANLAVNGKVENSDIVMFDGGEVEEGALVGRGVTIGGTYAVIRANTEDKMILSTRVTAADNAVIAPEGGGAGGTAVYVTEFLTKDAFDVVDAEGGGMRIIHKTPAEAGGPLEQFGTVGLKFSAGAKIIYQERIVRVESGSTMGDIAVGN